jgi:hypothetical protein
MLPVIEGKLPVVITAIRERAIKEALRLSTSRGFVRFWPAFANPARCWQRSRSGIFR